MPLKVAISNKIENMFLMQFMVKNAKKVKNFKKLLNIAMSQKLVTFKCKLQVFIVYKQKVGVFSCFRYDPNLQTDEHCWYLLNHINLNENNRNEQLLVHETCLALGIENCVYLNCCMNGSAHLDEDFRQSLFLCPIDLKKLASIFDFDIIKR